MMTEPESAEPGISDGRLLTGHVAEWGELLGVAQDRRGLTVVCADPWSGTSPLVAAALEAAGGSSALADARSCADALDLALTIADAAVATLAPEAYGWWIGDAPPTSTAGLNVWRALSAEGVDVDGLRLGHGRGQDRLKEALALVVALAGGPVTVAVDHLGVMLANLRASASRETLNTVRDAHQRYPDLDLILVDHPGGVVTEALQDPSHPLYRAGERLRITRPTPDRFVGDLAITRPLVGEAVPVLRAAADLAAGVPALIWRIIDLAPPRVEGSARAVAGWQALRVASSPSVHQEWDLLRRVHPAAVSVVSAMSLGLPPHSVPAASKSVDDALNRLRGVGLAWQPEPRRWVIADPLLAAHVRDHPPAWAARRSAYARARRGSGAAVTATTAPSRSRPRRG